MLRDLTILVSAAGSPTMPGVVECFRRNKERNIRIVGVDMCDDPTTKFIVDVFYKVPAASEDGYCDKLLEICKNEKVDIYFPNISLEVSIVSKRIKEFEAIGTLLSISNQESVAIANNKLHTYELLKSKNISVPNFYPVHSVQDFMDGCKKLGYPENPVCIKIVDGSGSRGVRIIDSKRNRYQIFVSEKPNSFFTSYEDMLSILSEADEFHEMMLVEYMPGNEYTVDILADKGQVLYEAGRENVVSLMSIAQESVVEKNEEAYKICREVVAALNMDGNVGFDFMKDSNGRPVLMDINPRITATVSVIAAAGINLPYLRVKQLLGEELPECKLNYGTRLKRRYGEIYTSLEGKEVTIGVL